MTRTVRSRRAEAAAQPLYARVLRLRHLAPSGLLCFVFLEGAVVLGILLALAELVSWWGVLILPITVALMVKLNDLVAGTFAFGPAVAEPASARVAVLRPAVVPPSVPEESVNTAGQSPADGVWSSPAYGHGAGNAPAGGGYRAGAGGQVPAGPRAAPVAGYARATTYGRPRAEGAGSAAGGAGSAVGGAGSAAGGAGSRPAGAGAPVRRPWADQLDVRQQVARQAAARRYE